MSVNKPNTGPAVTQKKPKKIWNWHPPLPLDNASIFTWPLRPLVALRTIMSYWFSLSGRVIILLSSILTWLFLTPDLNAMLTFKIGWVAQVYLTNLFLLVLFAGALHTYFYIYKKQESELQFDARPMMKNHKLFTFNDQVKDNIFWSIASGVTLWTVYLCVFLSLYANKSIPTVTFEAHPIYYVLLFVVIPLWYSFYFYWVHRAEHWEPLYKIAHAVHHRNINVGPWSGMAMHPVEHILYLGTVLIHLVIPSSPLHVIFHLQFTVLISVITHVGFASLTVNGKPRMEMGYFFHQLHHRYFDCNYGTDEMPWDKWFHTFHDGTPESMKRIKKLRKSTKLQ